MKTLVLATRNQGKLAEFRALVADLGLEVISLLDLPQVGEIEETGTTFQENALIKARQVLAITGELVVADDSGLEVDYLDGAPGVYSARFAGAGHNDLANLNKLLELLDGVPPEKRTARFRCALAIAGPGEEEVVQGVAEGRILEAPRGTSGFGYDPVFLIPELGKTMAELSGAEKNAVSHRGRAFRLAREILKRKI